MFYFSVGNIYNPANPNGSFRGLDKKGARMDHLIIGALAVIMIWVISDINRKRKLNLKKWQWILSMLWVLYGVFILELIVGFLGEDQPKAALVMGLITGLPAIIWAVLLTRFIFFRKSRPFSLGFPISS